MAALTDNRITALASRPPERGSVFVSDDHRDAPRGFAVRILASGSVSFVLAYKLHGRKHRKTIGTVPAWTLSQARAEARRLRQLVERGEDPFPAPIVEEAPYTIADLVADYMDSNDNRQADPYLAQLVAVHGDKLPAELTRGEVILLVERKAKTAPAAARQLLMYIKALYGWAADRERVPFNALAGIKPTRVSRALVAPRRERVLTDAEIKLVLGLPPSPHAAVLRAILVTGQRPGECREIVAAEVTPSVWRIPAERRKTKDEHAVPLTPMASEALRAVLTANRRPSEQSLTKFVRELQPGTDDRWRPHDLRRTARTRLAMLGVSDEVAERVIGHTVGGLIRVYNLHKYQAEVLAALTTYNDWLGRMK